jgi:hypothetical protein
MVRATFPVKGMRAKSNETERLRFSSVSPSFAAIDR